MYTDLSNITGIIMVSRHVMTQHDPVELQQCNANGICTWMNDEVTRVVGNGI